MPMCGLSQCIRTALCQVTTHLCTEYILRSRGSVYDHTRMYSVFHTRTVHSLSFACSCIYETRQPGGLLSMQNSYASTSPALAGVLVPTISPKRQYPAAEGIIILSSHPLKSILSGPNSQPHCLGRVMHKVVTAVMHADSAGYYAGLSPHGVIQPIRAK